MKKYIIKIEYKSDPIEADDEDDAINKFFEDVETTPQQTLGTFIFENTKAINITIKK